MKQLYKYILTLVVVLMTTTPAWAAWAGSGEAVKYENGTYYVVYQDSYEKLNTIETGPTILLSGPGELLQYEAKGSSSLTGAGRKYFYYSYSTNNGGNWTDKSQDLTTSYAPYEASLANNVNAIRFLTKTGSTYTKEVKNIRVTMAQYIETPSKTTIEFGSGKVDDTNSVASFTIPWCNVPAMTYTIEGSGSDCINISVENNSDTGKYNTATFTITYDRTKVSNLDATLTIKNSYNNYSKTIIITGSTSKYDQTLSWNNESAIETNMQLGRTQTVTATATSGLAVTYSSSDNSVLIVDASGKITAVRIGDATITASQAGNYKYNAADPSITKSYTVWNKNTPIFTPNGFNEANVCHLKVGDKVTLEVLNVSDGLSGDFKVKTDNNILGITRNGNTITIEALNAGTADAIFTQTENNDIFGAEKKYQFSVSKINNTLAIASSSYTKYVDDEITNIISSVNSDAAVTTSSSDATIAYYDVTKNKIFIPNSEAKSFSSKAITITIAQAETYKYTAAEKTITLTINKYTPTFTWNSANTPYYYGTSISNIFSTTNSDATSPVTIESNNAAFAHVENNTLYIANARETATITVTQAENYKWYGKTENYPISPVNGSKHVPFKIDTEAKYNLFKNSISTKGSVSWSGDKVRFAQENVGFNWDDSYYDIHFEGIPDVVTFDHEADWGATEIEWYVQESNDGINWSDKLGRSTSNSGSDSVTLQSSTRYLRFCYSGNLNGYISNIEVSERFQFEATPTAIDFGSEGITYGMQYDTITFLHANAGRITKAVITGADAKYFNVTPELIPGTGRDCFGNAALEVTFDNLGEDRGATPYNATLVISDNSDKTEDIHIPLTGIRDGKSTADIIWNPNALPYYFNTTIANIAYSTNRDANCPLTFATTDNTIAEVKNGDLYIYNKGQEVTITVTQPGNADFMPATESFTFTPCERPSLEVPFRVSQALHANSVQLGTKSGWYQTDDQIRIASTSVGDGFIWGDDRKRVLITFAGTPDKLYFEYSSSDAATPELATRGWEVEESANGTDWNTVWKTGSLSASWNTSGEIDLSPNTQYIRFSYKGNFAGYIRNIIISSLEGNNFLRAEEGTYLSRGAKYGTQAVVDPFGIACRVSRYTVDNTNIYTRFQFVDNMQYLWETHDTKELFTDDKTADNTANRWQIPNTSGKFTIQSGNNLGNMGQYLTINNNVLTLTSESSQATVWHMETPAEHNNVIRSYMDAAAAKAAEKDFGSNINTLEKVRSNLYVQDFEITEITVPAVALAEQTGEYRDGINGTYAVYDDTIPGLKPGFYRLTVKALYRISDSEKAQAAKTNGWESVLAYVYANDVKYPIQSVYTSYNAGSYDQSDEIYNGHSYPTKLNSVERAFNQDINRYLNDVYVYVEADPGQTTGTLRYGIKNPSYVPGAWLAYSTVTLTRFGRQEYVFKGTSTSAPTDWNTNENWNKDTVPNQYHIVKIEANVNISTPVEVYGISIDEGDTINITSTGGLTVGQGGVTNANDGSISIDNTPIGAGYFRIDPATDNKLTSKVKVNYSTRAYDSGSVNNEIWQYMGAPGKNMEANMAGATIYYWNETTGWQRHSGTMTPFAGYAFTQNKSTEAKYEVNVTPIFDDQQIDFTCTTSGYGMRGDNLFVNSYLAPIDITKIDEEDVVDDNDQLTKTFFIYNSGSWNQWKEGASDITAAGYDQSSAGHYYSIPFYSAKDLDPEKSQVVIPSMQGVYVYSQGSASLKLNYNKHVYKAETKNKLNRPMRAPQRETDAAFRRVCIQVVSENSGADRMYVIQRSNTTSGYDNGYDGDNIIAKGQANIYTTEHFGKMEVSCSNDIDSMYIGFTAGEDSEYMLNINAVVGEDLYLYDLENNSSFQLLDGEQYMFYAAPNSVNDKRFMLVVVRDSADEEQGGVTTEVDNVNMQQELWINDKMVYINHTPLNSQLAIYTISGMCVVAPYSINHTPCTIDLSYLPTGVYVIRLNNQAYKFVCK